MNSRFHVGPVAVRTAALALMLAIAGTAAADRLPFDDLVAALKSPSAEARAAAARELGASHRMDAEAPLEAIVRDPDWNVRREVVHALRLLRAPGAAAAIVSLINDPIDEVQVEAIDTMMDLFLEKRVTPPRRMKLVIEVRSGSFGRAAFQAGEDAVEPAPRVPPETGANLGYAVKDNAERVRLEAAYAAGILRTAATIPALINALGDSSDEVREAAALALGRLHSTAAGDALTAALNDTDRGVRRAAMDGLGAIRFDRAVRALSELFEFYETGPDAEACLDGLARIAHPTSKALFLATRNRKDAALRRLAVEGLARIDAPELGATLESDARAEKDEEVKLAYAFARARAGKVGEVHAIAEGLKSSRRREQATSYLLEIGAAAAPELYPYLRLSNRDARLRVIDILGTMGPPEAIGQLQPLLRDDKDVVADRANRAIERIKRREAAGKHTT